MKSKFFLFLCLAGLLFVYVSENPHMRARSQSETGSNNQGKTKFYPSAYYEDEQLVEKLIKNRNIDQLLQLAYSLEKKYETESEPSSQLLSRIANALSSYDFGDNRQYLYSEEIARRLLSRADEIPIEIEFAMVRQLSSDIKYVHQLAPVSEWPLDRAKRIAFLIHLDKRIAGKIERGFDLSSKNNRPQANLCPGAKYLCGIRPEDVKESDLRERYREALELNKIKGEKYNLQYKIHQIDSEMPRFIDKFLISLYSKPPFANSELVNNLTELKITGPRRDAIIRSVVAAYDEIRSQ